MISESYFEAINTLAWIISVIISYLAAILIVTTATESAYAIGRVLSHIPKGPSTINDEFYHLMTLYQNRKSEFMRTIKQRSIDVNKEMKSYGLSILQWLCTQHDIVGIQYLIKECQGQVQAKTAFGDTCLMLACAAHTVNPIQKYKTVELLIMEGCDVNATNWMNVTALSIATRMKDERLWKILFKNGAVVYATSCNKSLPYKNATKIG